MHHNLMTAIFIAPNSDSLHKFNGTENMLLNCDMEKSCLNLHDPLSRVSVYAHFQSTAIVVIGLLGIIGNIFSIVVLSRPAMKSSINCLLIGLAGCDIFVIAFAVIIALMGCIIPYTGFMFNENLHLLPYVYVGLFPLWYSAQVASVYLTIAVTLERYIAVCYPLNAKSICTISRSKKCVYIVLFCSILYHIPTFWETAVVEIVHEECNITVTCAYSTDFSRNKVYLTIYWEWLHSFLTFLIPFSSLAYFNACIFNRIKLACNYRKALTGSERLEKDQTRILLYIVALFFLCNSMFPILYTIQYFFQVENALFMMTLNSIAMNMFVVNSCINFIIYIVVGKKFKEVFMNLFRKASVTSQTTQVKYVRTSN